MKRIYSFITSLPVMAFLFLTLAFSMAVATFLESSYGTPAAQSLVYHSWWFELLWAVLALNLINNIFKYKLYAKRKLTLGLFHVAFLIILTGAVITRFISYEGVMHIREQQSSDQLISSDTYFYAEYQGHKVEKKVIFSELTPREFKAKFNAGGTDFKVRSVGYIENAERQPIAAENGEPAIDFVFAVPGGQGMQSYLFRKGDSVESEGFSAGFYAPKATTVSFFQQGDELFMVSKDSLNEMVMATQQKSEVAPSDTIPVKVKVLYSHGGYNFMVRNYYPRATFRAVKSVNGNTGEDAVIVNISDGMNEENIPVFGHSGMVGDTVKVPLSGGDLTLAYGAMKQILPFEIYLKDFQLKRYPGSDSPSSYASEVQLRDHTNGKKEDFRIYMNYTLKYKGFKFFQSSYDQDELGTILSVNHDYWGTHITYLGYFLMMLGFALSLLNPHSYFNSIVGRLKRFNVAKTVVFILLFAGGYSATAQPGGGNAALPDISNKVAEQFSRIWVQGHDGRVEPISTLSSELFRKVSRKSTIYGKSTDEAFLSMMSWPEIWRELPVIKVENKLVAEQLGTDGDYVSFIQLFDNQGNYRIADKVKAAYSKAAAFRNKEEKEYIDLDERINIVYMIFNGDFLKIFPSTNQATPWYTPGQSVSGLNQGDSTFVKSGVQFLIQSIDDQNSAQALQVINAIDNFQTRFGGELLPSDSKRNIEILYNKVNVFKRLFPYYLTFGFLLLLVLFINIFRQKPMSRILRVGFYSVLALGFLAHTTGLVVRWYISGHAPWSNGYESVVYVAWAVMLAGLIFGRKYPMVVGTAAFLSGIALFVAHLSWLNPEVTNLVPVLKSYWLAIHVAIITASYGFLGLSAFLGIMSLILITLRNKSNGEKVTGFIHQVTSINEMSAMVGLYALTTGMFLGGVWANESWGRYWGWDPKETWALITVMVYSFIAHMRLIPSLRGIFNFNMASVMGMASVIMTYFGVNYYLSGLHSYGKGIANGTPWALIITFILLGALMVFAWYKDRDYEKWHLETQSG